MMANLDITNEENEELIFDEEIEDNVDRFEICLVGGRRILYGEKFKCSSDEVKISIHMEAIDGNKHRDTNTLYLFRFYHKDDMTWMLNNGHLSFDNVMLVTSTILAGNDPTKVQLNEMEF